VGEEEDVFDPVPEADTVFVDVIVLEEVVEPVVVCDPLDETDRADVPVDVLEEDDDCVVKAVTRGVRDCISDRLGIWEATAVFVPVVVRVDVFDWVDVDVSATPFRSRCRSYVTGLPGLTGMTAHVGSERPWVQVDDSMKRKYI